MSGTWKPTAKQFVDENPKVIAQDEQDSEHDDGDED